jgi:hypothetical protein
LHARNASIEAVAAIVTMKFTEGRKEEGKEER